MSYLRHFIHCLYTTNELYTWSKQKRGKISRGSKLGSSKQNWIVFYEFCIFTVLRIFVKYPKNKSFYFRSFTSDSKIHTANDRNRRIWISSQFNPYFSTLFVRDFAVMGNLSINPHESCTFQWLWLKADTFSCARYHHTILESSSRRNLQDK